METCKLTSHVSDPREKKNLLQSTLQSCVVTLKFISVNIVCFGISLCGNDGVIEYIFSWRYAKFVSYLCFQILLVFNKEYFCLINIFKVAEFMSE